MAIAKKIIITFILTLNTLFASQNGLSIGKPIFLLLWSDTCPHCISFLNNTMSNYQVKNILNANFDVKAINVSKNPNVPYDIDFTGIVPSIHILNANGSQLVNTITGDIPANDLASFLRKFLELYREYEKSL